MSTRGNVPLSAELRQASSGADAALPAQQAAGIEPAEDSPRLVIRGESIETPHTQEGGESLKIVAGYSGNARILITPLPRDGVPPFAALTDWLNVTFPFDSTAPGIAIVGLLEQIKQYLTPKFGGLVDRGRGLHGYHHSFAFDNAGVIFCYGGQRGTGFLSITGEGCALVSDWKIAAQFLRDVLKARITRWDGAVDDYAGEYSVDTAMSWYLDGDFGTGGHLPSMKQMGNWAKPDGTGRTIYIGKREHGKMLRVYEKGRQLGKPESPWNRWEVQFSNRDRVIPFDVLLNPGPYVAGAYACLGWINKEASRIRTITKTAEIGYGALVNHCRNAYGRLLFVMEEVEGSSGAVLDKLRIEGIPKRLQMPDIEMPSSGVTEWRP
jgi:phage replication initiation protein